MSSLIRQSSIAVVLVLAANAFAFAASLPNLAPVVDELDDVIIGDAEGSSAANVFVFPNAINLDAVGHDDHTSQSALVWTYSSPTAVYVINGAQAVDPADDDLVNPPAAKRIDTQQDPLDPNGPRTITFRDNLRSPIDEAGGLGPYSNRHGSTSEGPATFIGSGVVTLYASDGTTVSLAEGKSVIIYTLDNGYDRLSWHCPDWVYQRDFRVNKSGWNFVRNADSITSQPQTGLCITGHRSWGEDASWVSDYPILELVGETAFEVAATVTTTNTNAFCTPMWMMVYDNISSDGTFGHDEYGGEIFILDNEGGANSPIQGTGRSEFRTYLMPIADRTPQFANSRTGFFTTELDRDNDFRLHFRMMSAPGYEYAGGDPSAVCIQKLVIYMRDLPGLVEDGTEYSVDHFADAKKTPSSPGAWQLEVQGQGSTPVFNADGSVTIKPTTDWTSGTVTMFRPGDFKYNFLGTDKDYVDNWPIPWLADQLYEIDFMLSAPSAWAEVNGPDVIRVGADTLTCELVTDNFAVPNTPDLSGGITPTMIRGLSMPRFGPPQKYSCFFYTHSVSKTNIPDGARWRPRFEILTSKALQPMGRATNLAGVTVHSVTVKRVHF